jgi:hypothetical protein
MKKQDVKNGVKVKIKGEIEYLQDMSFCKGSFPKDVVFTVVEKTAMKRYKLIANGYGMLVPENNYGNGAIYVSEEWEKFFIKAGDMFYHSSEPNKQLCSACGGTGLKV